MLNYGDNENLSRNMSLSQSRHNNSNNGFSSTNPFNSNNNSIRMQRRDSEQTAVSQYDVVINALDDVMGFFESAGVNMNNMSPTSHMRPRSLNLDTFANESSGGANDNNNDRNSKNKTSSPNKRHNSKHNSTNNSATIKSTTTEHEGANSTTTNGMKHNKAAYSMSPSPVETELDDEYDSTTRTVPPLNYHYGSSNSVTHNHDIAGIHTMMGMHSPPPPQSVESHASHVKYNLNMNNNDDELDASNLTNVVNFTNLNLNDGASSNNSINNSASNTTTTTNNNNNNSNNNTNNNGKRVKFNLHSRPSTRGKTDLETIIAGDSDGESLSMSQTQTPSTAPNSVTSNDSIRAVCGKNSFQMFTAAMVSQSDDNRENRSNSIVNDIKIKDKDNNGNHSHNGSNSLTVSNGIEAALDGNISDQSDIFTKKTVSTRSSVENSPFGNEMELNHNDSNKHKNSNNNGNINDKKVENRMRLINITHIDTHTRTNKSKLENNNNNNNNNNTSSTKIDSKMNDNDKNNETESKVNKIKQNNNTQSKDNNNKNDESTKNSNPNTTPTNNINNKKANLTKHGLTRIEISGSDNSHKTEIIRKSDEIIANVNANGKKSVKKRKLRGKRLNLSLNSVASPVSTIREDDETTAETLNTKIAANDSNGNINPLLLQANPGHSRRTNSASIYSDTASEVSDLEVSCLHTHIFSVITFFDRSTLICDWSKKTFPCLFSLHV